MIAAISNPLIEQLLTVYKPLLGKDYSKYRNHVYRVYLNCLQLDEDAANEIKYAYAAFFHDIGIWTADTFDYLQPSIAEACKYMAENGDSELVADITLMIYWHHKMTSYQAYRKELVEVFRKADWIDVSVGLLLYGCNRKLIAANRKIFPNKGFHRFLLWKAFENFLRHPFHPLPMFKK